MPSQMDFILSYYLDRPNQEVPHQEVVDWATENWKRETGNVFRDPDRAIRKLHQNGKLVKVRKGVYKYDPTAVHEPKLQDFTDEQKQSILKRDEYKCAICGLGKAEGQELHVDHIKPKELGGEATPENGQILCSKHNNLKKYYKQTETGKKMFINLLRRAKTVDDEELVAFCKEILKLYDQHGINGHIKWKDD